MTRGASPAVNQAFSIISDTPRTDAAVNWSHKRQPAATAEQTKSRGLRRRDWPARAVSKGCDGADVLLEPYLSLNGLASHLKNTHVSSGTKASADLWGSS